MVWRAIQKTMLGVRIIALGLLRLCSPIPLFPEVARRWLELQMCRTSVCHPRRDMELISIILSVGGSRCLEHSPLAYEAERLSVLIGLFSSCSHSCRHNLAVLTSRKIKSRHGSQRNNSICMHVIRGILATQREANNHHFSFSPTSVPRTPDALKRALSLF